MEKLKTDKVKIRTNGKTDRLASCDKRKKWKTDKLRVKQWQTQYYNGTIWETDRKEHTNGKKTDKQADIG